MQGAEMAAFRKWVLAGGIYNFVVGLPVAIPGLDLQYYSSMNALNNLLGLGGSPVVAPTDGLYRLFVSASGLLLCALGGMLLYAAGDLRNRAGIPFVNALSRIASVLLFLYYGLTANIARVMLSITLVDLLFAAVFLYYLSRLRGASVRAWVR